MFYHRLLKINFNQYMSSKNQNNKRIAKNTLALYLRMLIATIVSLFTARYTLILLGVEDYGINNVIGGLIGFMSIITGTMISATQRFLTFDLGKNDMNAFQHTFSMLINIFAVFSIIAILLLELIVPYFITNYFVIPHDRLFAAQCVFQFTIVNFVLSTMTIPYTSAIIAYERMSIYAYFTIIDVVGKFAVLAALIYTPFDRLITLALLVTIISGSVSIANFIYCKKKLDGCFYTRYWDFSLFKRMSSFAGWNLFGSTSWVLNQQGQAIILNLFFGPTINAAKAVADKINQIIVSFCNNFYMAVNPQITKSYAVGDIEYTKKLVLTSSKLCFFLMVVLCVPLQCNMKELLYLWLGKEQVSDEMVIFCILVLCFALINSLETPISQTIRATGNIKKYQILIGVQTLLFLPLTYLCFKIGLPSYFSMITLCIVYFVAHFTRVKLVSPILKFAPLEYVKTVFVPIIYVSVVCACLLYFGLSFNTDNIYVLAYRLIWSFMSVASCIFLFGMSKNERQYVIKKIRKRLIR